MPLAAPVTSTDNPFTERLSFLTGSMNASRDFPEASGAQRRVSSVP
jgi:hypothetical protein